MPETLNLKGEEGGLLSQMIISPVERGRRREGEEGTTSKKQCGLYCIVLTEECSAFLQTFFHEGGRERDFFWLSS